MSACASTATPRVAPSGDRTSARSDHASLVRTSSDSIATTARAPAAATPLEWDWLRGIERESVPHAGAGASARVGSLQGQDPDGVAVLDAETLGGLGTDGRGFAFGAGLAPPGRRRRFEEGGLGALDGDERARLDELARAEAPDDARRVRGP